MKVGRKGTEVRKADKGEKSRALDTPGLTEPLRNTVGAKLGVKTRTADVEQTRRSRLVSIRVAQGFLNAGAFHSLDRMPRGTSQVRLADGFRRFAQHVLFRQDGTRARQHGPFDGMLQLADVAEPWRMRERVYGACRHCSPRTPMAPA